MSHTNTIGGSPAGKYARTRPPPGGSEAFGGGTAPKMTTSQLMSIGRVPISGTTEISPIVEVLNMADYTHNVTSVVPISEPIFQASPSSVTIRNFVPLDPVHVEISFRNNDNVARRVKIVQPESPFFEVALGNPRGASKVAPGMDIAYVLKFTPEERIDYFCDLVCYTEREKFIIPVRCLGPRGWIDFPDQVFFDKAPVKAESLKTVLVRNVGEAEATVTLAAARPFRAMPPVATLGVGESMQVHFSFFPEALGEADGEFRIDYSTGESVVVHARGVVQELPVRLDSSAMLMDPTYVGLFSQKSFRIFNRSDETLKFCFKQFASASAEIKARMRFGAGFEDGNEWGATANGDVEYSDRFQNDSFSLYPAEGEVWPNSELEVTVTYSPSSAAEVACIAYCDIAGKENRFPLQLQGLGIGARIQLSYTVIDVGEVFINSVSEYDVELDNQGEIAAQYELIPSDTLFGSKFKFEPSAGMLEVGQKQTIKVSFSSDVLGDFNEDFGWQLQGTPQPLTLTMRGKVIGPTFHLDEEMLDFQRVSVAFVNSRAFNLFNTSDIPFRFHMRVPGDGAGVKKEFAVTPSTGTILPHGKQRVQIDLIAYATRQYNDLSVVMDIESVGEQMAVVRIKGEAIVPEVTVSSHELDFGECFLRYPYKKAFELVNHSDLPAKFELIPQEDMARCVAEYEVDCPKGSIDPYSHKVVTVSFMTERLDKVQLPMFFKVIGLEDEPIEIQCIAHGIGPKLTVMPPTVKWGDIEVLKSFEKRLQIRNDSLVDAEFKTLVMKRNSRFSSSLAGAVLKPGETSTVTLVANVDDTQQFKDELCLIVTEGAEIKVPLIAKGTGTTLWAPGLELGHQPSTDLGNQWTSRMARKTITITNKGPKAQTLVWFNQTAIESMQALKAAAEKKAEESGSKQRKVDETELKVDEVFRVEVNGSAEPVTVEAGATAVLSIVGMCKKPGRVVERLFCRSKMEKETRVVIELEVAASFCDPTCEFSSPSLDFVYMYDPGNPAMEIQQDKTVRITNTAPLALQCNVRTGGAPFLVEPQDVDLPPGGSADLTVSFDAAFRGQCQSEEVKQMLQVLYNMGPKAEPKNELAPQTAHPRKGSVNLNGSINYPNLKIDKTEVKFGAVLNDTTKRVKVRVSNPSSIRAAFSWSFVVSDKDVQRPKSTSSVVSSVRDPPQAVNAVFDILPTRGFLMPGQSEDYEFVFYGHANHKYRTTALCEVEGGPEYEVKLEGEASSIQFKLDRTEIDFLNALYDKFAREEITLQNTGKVRFDFAVRTDMVELPTFVRATPAASVVMPGEKVKIAVEISPGVPSSIRTAFAIEIAHFEPQVISVTGKGIFPHAAVSLPRVDPANYARLLLNAQDSLGISDDAPLDTARTEGMPGLTARTAASTMAGDAGSDVAASQPTAPGTAVLAPPPSSGPAASRKQTGASQRVPPPIPMEQFIASNPVVRQLLAEADCLGMREYILHKVQAQAAQREARRVKVIFDEAAEREALRLGIDPDAAAPPPTGPGGADLLGALTTSGTGSFAARAGPAQEPQINMAGFVLGEYVCDFGHVIKGQQVQREFRVTNVGFSQVSFELPKSLKAAITNAGFVIEPDKVGRLPGAPDFEAVDFEVLFNSTRQGVVPGPIDMLVPLAVRSGPQVNVYLRANVIVPDLVVSSETLRFGSVHCGHCRTLTVQLRNHKEIPCNWSFGQPILVEGGAPKPNDEFSVVPPRGSLLPGETCNVQVVFHPKAHRHYNVKIPLKVAQNPARKVVKIAAQSENLKLRFSPPMLELDPILPFVKETEARVTVFNDSDKHVEFFSADFDQQYHEEEEVLRDIEIYAPERITYQDVALLPLRAPGSGLQAEALRAYKELEAARAAEAEAERREAEAEAARAAAEEGGGGSEGEGEGEADGADGAPGESPGGAGASEGGKLLPVLGDADTETVNMLVFAHPLAGGPRVAQALAVRYCLGVLVLEAMLQESLALAGVQPCFEEQPVEEEGGEVTTVRVPNKWQLDKDAAPAGAIRELQEVFFPPASPPEEGHEPAAEREAELGEDGHPVPAPPRTAEVEEGWLQPALLQKLVALRLRELRFVRGVVVDGLALSALPDAVAVAGVLKRALAGKTLQVVHAGWQEPDAPPEPAEGEGEGAVAAEGAEDGEPEEKAPMAEEHEAREMEGDMSPSKSRPESARGPPQEEALAAEDPLAVEEELSEEERAAALARYEEVRNAVLAALVPVKQPEGGGEEAEAEAELEAEEAEAAAEEPALPTQTVLVSASRQGLQKIEEVVMDVMARLPAPAQLPGEPRVLPVPAVFDCEIVTRPYRRLGRRPITNFYILTPEPMSPGEEAEAAEAESAVAEGEGGEAPAEGEEAEAPAEKPPRLKMVRGKTRWSIPPKSSMELVVRFLAEDTGRFDAMLAFEIMGGGVLMRGKEFTLPVRGQCAYPHMSQNVNNLYYKKIRAPPPHMIVRKQYVMSREVFEFGPLLVGKEKEGYKEKYEENRENFRITNNGQFDMHIDFCFRNDTEGKVWVVEPEELDLAVDQTQDVTVYAFTEEEGEFQDALICNIRDNPEPVAIPLSCIGASPTIVTDIEVERDEEGNAVEGPLKLEFQRLLLKRKDVREVKLTNTSLVPTKWHIKGAGEEEGFNTGGEFSIFPIDGLLQPNQSEILTIGFNAIEKNTFEKPIELHWIDEAEQLPGELRKKQDILITAEAYEIDFTFKFGEDTEKEGLDFKTVKVVDGRPPLEGEEDKIVTQQSLKIVNNGKYKVGYRFAFSKPKKSLAARYFDVQTVGTDGKTVDEEGKPNGPSGELEPDSEAEIRVLFNAYDQTGAEEIDLRDNTELKCHVSELLTQEDIFITPIAINVRSVFSKYRVLPQKGVAFGALTYDTSKSRTFDIVNQGDFEFGFSIACITKAMRSRPGTAAAARTVGEVRDTDEGEPTADGQGMKFGNFTVTPFKGTVPPNGEKATITVNFDALGQQQFFEMIGIQVDDRDPAEHPLGMPYELSGESCVPGIVTTDFLQIFEEAVVSRKMPNDPNEVLRNIFIEEDRVFHFGPRLVGSRSETRIKIVNPTKVPVTVNLECAGKGEGDSRFEILEKQLQLPMHEHRYATVYFTPDSLQQFSGMLEATVENGTDERTNKLALDLRGEGTLPRVSIKAPAARNDAGQGLLAFKRLLVGKQQEMQISIVNDGILPATVRFGKVMPFPLPADPKAPVEDGLWARSFTFAGKGAEIFLQPKEERTYEVVFRPPAVPPAQDGEEHPGRLSASVEMAVQNNEFGRAVIEMTGEAYQQDVSFENMPPREAHGAEAAQQGGSSVEDELHFGHQVVGVPCTRTFTVANNSQHVYRFSWEEAKQDAAVLSFAPCVGHIQPGDSKSVVVTFNALAPVSMDGKALYLKIAEIAYAEGVTSGDWDDTMKDIEFVMEDADADASLAGEAADGAARARAGKRKPRRVVTVRPEPEFTPIKVGEPPAEGEEDTREDKTDDVFLKVHAEADFLRYGFRPAGAPARTEDGEPAEVLLDLPPLAFAETMMFRERVHSFSFVNPSKAALEYAWAVCLADGAPDTAEDSPFYVTPERGTLAPGAAHEITVKFAPTEVDHYQRRLVATVPNLDMRVPKPEPAAPEQGAEEAAPPAEEGDEPVPEPQAPPQVVVQGKSARPRCHLELADSDWLTGGRRPPTLATPSGTAVDPASRVVEFESLGTGVRNTKRFYVMNPTNASYRFRWDCEDGTGAAVAHIAQAFKCVHKEGIVLSGKKTEMVFEYTPDTDRLLESFWRLTIPDHDVSVPFILVGHVKEPRVFLDQTFCNFNSLLLNHKGTQMVKLVNREHIPFAFAFDGKTYGADEDPPTVKISPSQGTVGPESELQVTVQFMPQVEKRYNFNAVCYVKKKATRLALNVKGEGFDNHVTVAMEEERGAVNVFPSTYTPIDFGEVHVNETRVKSVSVANTGKYPIEFEWATKKNSLLTIHPQRGVVPKGEKVEVKMAFFPVSESSLQDHLCHLQIVNGNKYTFGVSATGRKPHLAFSFTTMDFGACFLYKQEAQPLVAVLRVTNEDTHDVSFDVQYNNKPWLEVEASPTNLAPGQSEEIKMSFMPREIKSYVETIPFQINGLYMVNVEVKGSGHDLDVTLANSNHFNYALGAVKVGSVVERRIKIKNASPVVANVNLEQTIHRLEALDVRLRPAELILRPRESADLELTYAPESRMLPFTEDIKMDIGGLQRTLMVLGGSAVGVELKLETDMLFFGAVVANSRAVRRVQLENIGDIGAQWRWAADLFAPSFSVQPTEGFLNPHDEVTLELTFHPQLEGEDIRCDNVPLYVEGADQPLALTLTGICVAQTPQEETIAFETAVRAPVKKALPAIANPTDTTWRLIPSLDNDFWSGPEVIEVPPKQSVALELTYRPLSMTAQPEDKEPEGEETPEGEEGAPPPAPKARRAARPEQHTGAVFVPLPDGTALLYNLVGTAGPPLVEGEKIVVEVQCKASHTEMVPVTNWLPRPQRFTVQIDPVPEGTTTLKGAHYIDVPPNVQRPYSLKFHTFVEGTTAARLTLTNEETREYLYYDVEFQATGSPPLQDYALSTVVRQGKELLIDLANPLVAPVTMTAACHLAEQGEDGAWARKGVCSDVVLQESYDLRASAETPCRVVYRPVLPSAPGAEGAAALVTFSSAELGDFVYLLRLTASPAGAERSMQFKAAIGGRDVQTFRFLHFLPAAATYQCETDNAQFAVAATAAAPEAGSDGAEVAVEVVFEPDRIGDCAGKLTVASPEGGEYVCILKGYGAPPQPQGPYEVAGSYKIDFTNPFSEARSFTVAVDNKAFTVPRSLDNVAPRSTVPINVSYAAGAGETAQGNLTVVCDGFPAWLYYLKGA